MLKHLYNIQNPPTGTVPVNKRHSLKQVWAGLYGTSGGTIGSELLEQHLSLVLVVQQASSRLK